MTTMLHVLSILFDFGSSLRLLIIQKNKQLSLFAEFEEVLIQKVALDLTSKETNLKICKSCVLQNHSGYLW